MKTQVRDIEYFAAVAEHGQIQRAAAALGLTQPALSKSLHRLEQTVGAKLAIRTPKGIELTAAGSALLARAGRLRVLLDDIAQEVSDIAQGRTGHVSVGVAAGLIRQPVARACTALQDEMPNVMVTVAMATTDALLAALRNKEFDLVVAPMPSVHAHDLVEEHLFDDEFVVIARRGHRLTRRKQVRLPDLSRERWALLPAEAPSTRMVHRVFQENGLRPPRVAITSGALELRDYLVSTTDLLGYSSTRVAREVFALTPFAEIRVKELERVRRVGMFYRKDGYLSPAATRFVEVLSASASVIRGDG